MFEEKQLQKASLLFERQRYAEAEKEYALLLGSAPANGYFHAMLALCALYQDKNEEAERHAREAIHLSPSEGFSFYVAALVALSGSKLKEADTHIYSAITLDAYQASYYELKGLIALAGKEWQKALSAANEGLAIESDHVGCLNCRAKALIKLDNKEEAYSTIHEALYFDPENSVTHANLGWGLLEKGEYEKALNHFKQALSFDAGNDFAKSGMIEALKARYWFYRLFLRYAFWIGNMKVKAQWAVIIGFYLGSTLIRNLGTHYPALQVVTIPIVVLYTVFALTTWIITPLSNLFLRLNVYGRYALSEEEIRCSNYIGICLLVALLSGIGAFVLESPAFLMLAILSFSITIPVSGTFAATPKSKGRKQLLIYTFVMVLVGLLGIIQYLVSGEMFNAAVTVYLLAFIVYQWVGNAIIVKS